MHIYIEVSVVSASYKHKPLPGSDKTTRKEYILMVTTFYGGMQRVIVRW